MAKLSRDEIMDILTEEYAMEMDCAFHSRELAKKTWNPFKRIQHMRTAQMFMDHARGIDLVIFRIKRKES